MATKILIEFDNTRAKGGAKGLAEAAKLFEKVGLKPVDYSVEEKTKRSAGRSYKRVFFNFEDAQRVEMWVTYDKKAPIKGGDIFKVKLGGAGVAESIRATELPITNQDDHAEAIKEIVKALQSNEKKFQAKLAKIKVELPPDLTTSKVKKIELLENRIKELDEAIEMAGKELAALHDPNRGAAVASESPAGTVDLQATDEGGASSEWMPGKDSHAGESKPIQQSELPISQRRYSLEELSDPATYQDDPALAKIARDIGVSRFNDLFASTMGRGDAKRAMTSGQYPQLVADEIEKIISKQEAEFKENQKGIISALALSINGYSIEPSATEIIIRGKFDEDLHSRIKRIGYWDGATYANRKVWVIPASKGGSLKTIFKNHLVAKDANEKARQDAAAEAYEKAQAAEKARRDARIEQQRKDAIAKSTRVKVEEGKYKVGDKLNGKKISSFGSPWEEGGDTWVQVTDENSSAYGYQPGLDYYPKIKVSTPSAKYRYAYLEVDQ